MKLSIVTPSYNQAEFLERTIKSVVNQKGIGKDYELEYIIMDGGSTDGSVDIIKRYAKNHPFIKWQSKKDKGQSDALQQGFNKATGEIIAWINSDDEYTKGAFSRVMTSFADMKTQWVTGHAKIVDERNREILRGITAYKNFLCRLPSKTLYTENFVSQPSTFFRKSLYEHVGGINPALHYCMDYDLWLRFLQKADPVIIRRDLSLFRRYSSSKSGAGFEKQFKEQYAIAKQYTSNQLLLALHRLQNLKTVLIYRLVS